MPRGGRVVIGVITGSHGVDGEARMSSYLVGNMDLEEVREITVVPPKGKPSQRRLIRARPGPRRGTRGGGRRAPTDWIILLEGIHTPEEARAMKDSRVEVNASLLEPAKPGEYYWRDLIGLEVETIDGRSVGKVTGLIGRGEQDLLKVGAGEKEALIPLVEPIVVLVDIEAGRMVVDPPEGLVD